MKTYKKIFTQDAQPEKWGWYDTNKGNLFWTEKDWSCREDHVSEEYPEWWLKQETISRLTETAPELLDGLLECLNYFEVNGLGNSVIAISLKTLIKKATT